MNDIFCLTTRQNVNLVLIDAEDVALVQSHNLFWGDNKHSVNARSYIIKESNGKKGAKVALHRLVSDNLKRTQGYDVDHINRNPYDNRKCNLRLIPHCLNVVNSEKALSNSGCRYKGVSWHKRSQKWQVHLVHKGIKYYGGLHDTQKDAAIKANEIMKQIHGEHACLNVIE